MKVGYFQFKPERGNPLYTLEKIKERLLNAEADLLVLPELAFTGYLLTKEELNELAEDVDNGIILEEMKKIAGTKNMAILYGFPERDREGVYNSAVLVHPGGNLFIYRKIHLFGREKELFLPGDRKPELVEYKGVKMGIIICYDWAFPELTRSYALMGAHLILHPSNLILPFGQRAMWTRAVENRVFTITANRTGEETLYNLTLRFTGMSQIVSPMGDILASSGKEEEDLKVVDIEPKLAENKTISENTDVFKDRRPGFYDPLCG